MLKYQPASLALLSSAPPHLSGHNIRASLRDLPAVTLASYNFIFAVKPTLAIPMPPSQKGTISMPTIFRHPSSYNIYHVILRSTSGQRIFEDDEDFRKFLYILHDYQAECDFRLIAYCIMHTHVHLLVIPGKIPLGRIILRISPRFVQWYNAKYHRSGNLFRSSYFSRPVNSIRQLFTVVRYIHQNPVKAGMCSSPYDYKYSSFNDYFTNSLIDGDFMLSLISPKDFIQYNLEKNNDTCLDVDDTPKRRVTDEEAIQLMDRFSGCKNASEFQFLEVDKRTATLTKMLQSGVSLRQASRVTGVSYALVRKCRP